MAPVITHDEGACLQVRIDPGPPHYFQRSLSRCQCHSQNALHSAHASSHYGVSYRTTCYEKWQVFLSVYKHTYLRQMCNQILYYYLGLDHWYDTGPCIMRQGTIISRSLPRTLAIILISAGHLPCGISFYSATTPSTQMNRLKTIRKFVLVC